MKFTVTTTTKENSTNEEKNDLLRLIHLLVKGLPTTSFAEESDDWAIIYHSDGGHVQQIINDEEV